MIAHRWCVCLWAQGFHDVKKVLVRKVGHERILTPVNHIWDNFFMAQEGVSDDFLPERANQQQCDREEF